MHASLQSSRIARAAAATGAAAAGNGSAALPQCSYLGAADRGKVQHGGGLRGRRPATHAATTPGGLVQPRHVPTKTSAGVDEIATRRHRLSTRSRTLLIAIDGQHTVAELQTMFASFGDVGLLLGELAALGLIHDDGTPRHPTPLPAASAPAAAPTPASQPAAAPAGDAGSADALMQARQLMNSEAVASLGFRAFGFTLKLEHCYSADELRGLLPTFLQLMTKAKGAAVAADLQQRLEGLIGRG